LTLVLLLGYSQLLVCPLRLRVDSPWVRMVAL
jgi:hypothetical protein